MSSGRQRARAHSGERTAKSYRGAGAEAQPPELTHWGGLDLVRAAEYGGEQLLATLDGRRFVLLRRDVHRTPGNRLAVSGVTQALHLTSLMGVVTGGSFELWSVSTLWSATVRSTATRPR